MKNILYVISVFASYVAMGQASWHEEDYLPNGINSSNPTEVVVVLGPVNPAYLNMEKYWYYRYRLVNDFLFIDDVNTLTTVVQVMKDGRMIVAGPGHQCSDLTTPGNYSLYVSDGILTEHVRVADHTASSWSDYVFDKDYKLMPLPELEAYIKEHKHLPDIPTAKDVAKDGYDVQDIDSKLLKNIEELKLYAIAQQKEIDELKQELHELIKKQDKK